MSNWATKLTGRIPKIVIGALFMIQLVIGCKSDPPYYLRGDSNTSYVMSSSNNNMIYTTTSDDLHNLHLINLKTQRVKTILKTDMYINNVTITNDNSYILFSASKSAVSPCHIYRFNLHSHKLRQLTTGDNSDLYPSYYPHQNRVLFIRSNTLRNVSTKMGQKCELRCCVFGLIYLP